MTHSTDTSTIVDILSLVSVTATPEQVDSWTEEQREAATDWAASTHLSASDNDVEVPPKPAFLDQPQSYAGLPTDQIPENAIYADIRQFRVPDGEVGSAHVPFPPHLQPQFNALYERRLELTAELLGTGQASFCISDEAREEDIDSRIGNPKDAQKLVEELVASFDAEKFDKWAKLHDEADGELDPEG
jgi:hypothetical protein